VGTDNGRHQLFGAQAFLHIDLVTGPVQQVQPALGDLLGY
jgi:hypothetical protein